MAAEGFDGGICGRRGCGSEDDSCGEECLGGLCGEGGCGREGYCVMIDCVMVEVAVGT